MGSQTPKIAICGPGRSGKDTAAEWFAGHTVLRFGRTTSEVIAPHAAARLGLPVDVAFAQRHADRQLWFAIGVELQQSDPAYLVRETLRDAEISVGLRSRDELAAVRGERLVDLVAWIDRD